MLPPSPHPAVSNPTYRGWTKDTSGIMTDRAARAAAAMCGGGGGTGAASGGTGLEDLVAFISCK